MKLIFCVSLVFALILFCNATVMAKQNDPLPSCEGASKQAITQFVKDVSTAGEARFFPLFQRIAVFENVGTLWAEQPMYFQLAFVLN